MQYRNSNREEKLLFEGKLRVSYLFGLRFYSGVVIAILMAFLFAYGIHWLVTWGLLNRDLQQWSLAYVVVTALLCLGLSFWLYDRIWQRKVRIVDMGTQVLVQVGNRVDCYDWRELRRVKPSQLRNKSRRLVVVSLVLVFEERTYRFSSSDKTMGALMELAQTLETYLVQS
ncbi:hypothetical protein [uncultured Abiotrophia sp.]|uniref:hypothetical protein n=1 Tax=uncultured Abiotrophia sp. TaxID=316094 RepID=UPI00261E496C|nr:hypothetical protein [uncultured Abiotrophia sp.]